jgi:hypothetical protein
VTKNKKPKAPKAPKPTKQPKRAQNSKSLDVKVSLPVTKVSIMSLLLVGLLAVMGYAGYLGVTSIWKFTHPQFNVSLDALKSLDYIAKQVSIPIIPGPLFNEADAPNVAARANYLRAMSQYNTEFRIEYPESRLLEIKEPELLNIGSAFCAAKKDAVAKTGDFSREEIVKTFQAKFILRYPRIEALGPYLDAVAQRAFDHLCGGP